MSEGQLSNLLLDTDSYKASHWLQYPEGTEAMFSYLESRGGMYQQTLFFGLQYYIKRYLLNPIQEKHVKEADAFFKDHGLPFNHDGFMSIVKKHKGLLPLKIKAVPEGTLVPVKNILMSVESTDPELFWVVSYFETLLMRIWYPITVATISWHCRQIMMEFLSSTAADPEQKISRMLHDFGSRGVSSRESASIGGAAHLVSFQGSDTVVGVDCANKYYNHPMAGFSIPAAEHSTMTALGREGELDQMRLMLDLFAKEGSSLAVVSDSYDIFRAVERFWSEDLKKQVIDSGATVVVRPDSGDPVKIVTMVVEKLAEGYGTTINQRGYKVLNSVRVMQGDGVDPDSIRKILFSLKQNGYSAENVAFGMGGALLQKCDRDTQRFAYKCSAIKINGEWRDIFKDPVTDSDKKSKAGRLDLIKLAQKPFETVQGDAAFGSILEPVYENGRLIRDTKLSDIRKRAKEL